MTRVSIETVSDWNQISPLDREVKTKGINVIKIGLNVGWSSSS